MFKAYVGFGRGVALQQVQQQQQEQEQAEGVSKVLARIAYICWQQEGKGDGSTPHLSTGVRSGSLLQRCAGPVHDVLCCAVQVFNPRLFVVKSYHLKRLVNRCQMFFCPSNHNKQPHTAAATALEADADSDVMAHWQQPQEQLQQQPHPGAADETDADNDFTTDWQQQQQEDKEQQQQQHTDARSFGNVLAADAAAGAPCQQQQQLADAQLWEEIC